jgi:hypothetical protein
MKPAMDRRVSVRHTPARYDTHVHIMDWTGSWVTKARLLNVCIGGAFMVTHSVVAPGQKLHVRLANAPEIGWIDAHVVHVEQGRGVGIRFRSRCSSEFVLAAARGGNPRFENSRDEDTPMIEKRNDWLAVV